MTGIFDCLRNAANRAASYATATLADIDRQMAEIEQKKQEIEADRLAARNALKRAANYPVKSGVDFLCPLCWVNGGKTSLLRGVRSQYKRDIFRCSLCHYEVTFNS